MEVVLLEWNNGASGQGRTFSSFEGSLLWLEICSGYVVHGGVERRFSTADTSGYLPRSHRTAGLEKRVFWRWWAQLQS